MLSYQNCSQDHETDGFCYSVGIERWSRDPEPEALSCIFRYVSRLSFKMYMFLTLEITTPYFNLMLNMFNLMLNIIFNISTDVFHGCLPGCSNEVHYYFLLDLNIRS